MLKSIKAIFENATEKDIANVEFQRYIRLMTRSDKYKCCNCGDIKEGRYLGINIGIVINVFWILIVNKKLL